MDDLSDVAWRVFTGGLMWSVENGTDGFIPERYTRWLHPDGPQESAFAELVKAGVWKRTSAGYQFVDWEGDLGQSTAQEVEAYREKNRIKAQRHRARVSEALAKQSAATEFKDPTAEDVTGDVTGDVPQVRRQGKGLGTDNEVAESVNSATGEVPWPVAEIPQSDPGSSFEWHERDDNEFERVARR